MYLCVYVSVAVFVCAPVYACSVRLVTVLGVGQARPAGNFYSSSVAQAGHGGSSGVI